MLAFCHSSSNNYVVYLSRSLMAVTAGVELCVCDKNTDKNHPI